MPSANAVHQDYIDLIAGFNSARLVGDENRVPMLRRLVAALGHPDKSARVIHIAGTNGKGSTGAMLASILHAAGYRVGRFSSPAILNEREQVQINGQWISESAFVASYRQIIPTLGRLDLDPTAISVFEWQFLISLVWFQKKHVDFMILEAGLGGLTDATNAISAPRVTVLTKIALDHTQTLGETVAEIAFQKAQIIKPNTTVVTSATQVSEVLAVIQRQVDKQGVLLRLAQQAIWLTAVDAAGMTVNVTGPETTYNDLRLNLIGDYQRQNLNVVLTVVEVLQHQQVSISQAAVRQGLSHVHLPDRLATVAQNPWTVVDVAHNPDGMAALVSSLTKLVKNQSFVWVVGVLADKAVDELLAVILPTAQELITVTPANPERALPASQLAQRIKTLSKKTPVRVAASMKDALKWARTAAGTDGLVVISGSFYVARQVTALMEA